MTQPAPPTAAYRPPAGKFIPRTKQTAELYKLEQARAEAIMREAAELKRVLDLEYTFREAMPEEILRILKSLDPKAAYLACQVFIANHALIGSELEAGERRYAFVSFPFVSLNQSTQPPEPGPTHFGIARVYENQPGYEILPSCGPYLAESVASQIAHKMNLAAGILDIDAAFIVASSEDERK